MNLRRNAAALAAVAVVVCVLFPVAAGAADVVTVGTVTATGSTVDVPVYIRDLSGTSLGMDRPAGSKIQSFSIKVDYSPASAVQSVTFSRAGITANLTPTSEFKPSGSGSVSLLDTFQESTNPIPFALNASAPGNLVAHLVFTLSPSAAPSSSIALTLDATLTQLTDSGGTAATKETTGNGSLTLVHGQINIPALTVSLSPSSRTIAPGGSGNLSAILSGTAPGATTVNLTSSDTNVVTVPASVVIAAGTSSASFQVTAVALGTAKITATMGSSTDDANITVSNEPAQCTTPAAPQLTAPASAGAGAPYSVTWSAVNAATEYVLEESDTDGFASPVAQTVTGTSASFTHGTGGIRHYYRIRARNHVGTCDVYSGYSPVVSVLISDTPLPTTRVLPVVGSLAGNFGSFFRTSLQLYNPHGSAVSGRIVFHPAGAAGSDTDPSLTYSILPGKTLAFADLLPAMGVAGGIGSADLIADATSGFPVALGRVFNDAGAAGTSGFGEDALPIARALQAGSTGALLAPDDAQRFRLNIGVRTLDSGAAMTITVRDRDGAIVKTVTRTDGPVSFFQVSSFALLGGYVLTGGETISFELTSGSAFIYGATTDNVTNDPSVQIAARIE
ncbi:MAG: hypothetical protein QOJ98_3273 [Acidobacteriota bacterium]|jgi:hypothetical protein|nr:hypothetical protein [Acidobacteriota bacterium]